MDYHSINSLEQKVKFQKKDKAIKGEESSLFVSLSLCILVLDLFRLLFFFFFTSHVEHLLGKYSSLEIHPTPICWSLYSVSKK